MDVFTLFKKYKTKTQNNQIYDPIRKKFVALTPEEIIRQKTIQFMLKYMEIPSDKLSVETSLSTLGCKGNKKRIDICIYNTEGSLTGIVECKANHIGYGEAPYQQALDYVTTIGISCYFVVDGVDFIGFFYDSQNDQFIKMDTIPKYTDIIKFEM